MQFFTKLKIKGTEVFNLISKEQVENINKKELEKIFDNYKSLYKTKVAKRKMFNPYNHKQIKDIAPTQTTSCGNTTSSSAILISEDGESYMRIRKLTPLECWRLMGFDDSDFIKAKSVGISDTQLYKQAGNSIVVNVLEYILKELLCEEQLEQCA